VFPKAKVLEMPESLEEEAALVLGVEVGLVGLGMLLQLELRIVG
jgi:hypothetical protein